MTRLEALRVYASLVTDDWVEGRMRWGTMVSYLDPRRERTDGPTLPLHCEGERVEVLPLE